MKNYNQVNENIRLAIKQVRNIKTSAPVRAKKIEDKLIISLDYLVLSAIFKYKDFNNYNDLYQEGMIGLIKAIQNFNPELSFHFVRYAMWWIKARINRSIKKLNMQKKITNDEVNYLKNDINEITPEQYLLKKEILNQINDTINNLPILEKTFIKLRYGLNNEKIYNKNFIIVDLNITYKTMYYLECKILQNLRINNLNE